MYFLLSSFCFCWRGLGDGDFLAGVDVDAGRGGLGAVGAAGDIIPQAVLDLARMLTGHLGEGGGVLQDVFQASCRVDFSISPADGVGGGELVVAAGVGQDIGAPFPHVEALRFKGLRIKRIKLRASAVMLALLAV